MMISRVLAFWCSIAVTFVLPGAALPEFLSNARPLPAPSMDLPDYLVPTVDPSIGTTFVRVTTPKSPLGNGVACKLAYCTHRYSNDQAWNADHSLLVIVNGCNDLCTINAPHDCWSDTHGFPLARPIANHFSRLDCTDREVRQGLAQGVRS